jgi:FAD/FMN-containing dehydrogenase
MAPNRSTLTRREFLGTAGVLLAPRGAAARPSGTLVNDVHSQLNATSVREVMTPDSVESVRSAIRGAADRGYALSIAGGRHAMGGQQFGEATTLLDLRSLKRVRHFDPARGTIEIEAGIQWPDLVAYLVERQRGATRQWGIAQKQTGADRLTLGGALAANAHGRGLRMAPFVADVESFELVDARGSVRVCSRERDAELFRLVIGGYGLFGVVTAVTLRLTPRRKLQRVVEVRAVEGLMDAFDARVADGCLYGDFQFDIDPKSDGFMRRGVFSCYRAVADSTPIAATQKELADSEWAALLTMAHADKTAAFDQYSSYYLTTSGQVYWSDLHQMSTYLDDYHRPLDLRLGRPRATEMITEIYVPRPRLADFFREVRDTFRENGAEIVYGTVRLIEQDAETFLPWARLPWACTIFNLHVEHTPHGIERSADAFRTLIDMAIRRGGSYFLTYHRHARREQVEACYPQLAEFLRLKKKHDPELRFQSEWYRHYARMFAEPVGR